MAVVPEVLERDLRLLQVGKLDAHRHLLHIFRQIVGEDGKRHTRGRRRCEGVEGTLPLVLDVAIRQHSVLRDALGLDGHAALQVVEGDVKLWERLLGAIRACDLDAERHGSVVLEGNGCKVPGGIGLVGIAVALALEAERDAGARVFASEHGDALPGESGRQRIVSLRGKNRLEEHSVVLEASILVELNVGLDNEIRTGVRTLCEEYSEDHSLPNLESKVIFNSVQLHTFFDRRMHTPNVDRQPLVEKHPEVVVSSEPEILSAVVHKGVGSAH
mmetsp:Transcript_66071/g.184298  ORF Transcript_66071/g.184298 Transcript_66071/m.184298 type:complete len:273 (-) Transcript_66071:762-1580(-)